MRHAEGSLARHADERSVDIELHAIDIAEGRRHFDREDADRLATFLRREKRHGRREP